ncbi:hypothetical protein GGF44_000918 [Coemansia sp. RSA 1694]|nr:hypothetical protein GGF38_001163 [Coemansia sp. RSA 25]KAJ2643929.1 hypothetical protein GGF44_000918 [Coemansia sp. RSA 1694]
MEYFTDNVESQTIELAVLDTLSSFSNIPFIYHFENTTADKNDLFMPTDVLRVTFYKALLEFPILAGHLHMGYDGRASVVIDRNNLNLPEYRESTCDVHFDQLKAASYNWDMFPKDLVAVSVLTTAGVDGVIKLANFHCARLRDNSGMLIFANMSHYVVDGVGFCAFMGRWAEYCQLACSKVGAVLQHHEFTFDRNIVNKMLSFKRRPISDAASHLFFVHRLAASALAWISPILRGRILSAFLSMSKAEAHMFHISRDRLEALRSSLVDYIPSDMRLSDNDLIASLASMTIVNGLNRKSNSNGGVLGRLKAACGRFLGGLLGKDTTEHITFLIADTRHRLGIGESRYTGNCVIPQLVINPLQRMAAPITSETHAHVACRVRAAVQDFDRPYISQFIDTLNKHPSSFAQPLVYTISHPEKVFITNQSRFPLYDLDYGFGTPAWVSPIPISAINFVKVMPVHPSQTGYNIHMTTTAYAMSNVLCNSSWQKLATLIF